MSTPLLMDSGIVTCDCVAAEANFLMYMRHGCRFSRWVRIGSRIKPVEAYGAPYGTVVCTKPERPRAGLCPFQSISFLMRDMETRTANQRARERLQAMEDSVRKLRAEKGIQGHL
ncbi:MAG: hypothetical protein LUO93_02420 [Methanomicrobiales archaeon]|nr:hypothetical protein [Methanomicrobiales archaeon]